MNIWRHLSPFHLFALVIVLLSVSLQLIQCQMCSSTSGTCIMCPLNGCTKGTLCTTQSDCQTNLCVAKKCVLCSYGCTNGNACLTQNDCLHNVCEYGICARCTLPGCSNGNVCTKSADCVPSNKQCNIKNLNSALL